MGNGGTTVRLRRGHGGATEASAGGSTKGGPLSRSTPEGEETRQPEGEQCQSRGLGGLFDCEEVRLNRAGIWKDGADAPRRELLDGEVGIECHVEVARAVKGQALWAVRAGGAGEERGRAVRGDLLDSAVSHVSRIQVACTIEGQAEWVTQAGGGEDGADAPRRELLDGAVALVCRAKVARAVKGQAIWGA